MSRTDQEPGDGTSVEREQLLAAMSSAKDAPERDDAWDRVEALASSLDCPDEVAELYGEVLGRDLPPEVIARVGERATRFHEEWFGEASPGLAKVLVRVLEVEPKSDEALQRLTAVFTVQGRWNELLDQYDRVLEATKARRRRGKLLEEAANIAKDLAGMPERAAKYLQALLELRPDDAGLAVTLERLLERHERFDDLIALWTSRLALLEGEDAQRTRARIARAQLERKHDPERALSELRAMIDAGGDAGEADELLEAVLGAEDAPPETRLAALELLRPRYRATGNERGLIAALETGIQIADHDVRQALREEVGGLLAAAGDGSAAMDHLAALLERDPANARARADLRRIAETAGAYATFSDSLARAAEAAASGPLAVELLREAARVRLRRCADPQGAASMLDQAITAADDDADLVLASSREQVEALRGSGHADLLIAALSRLTELEAGGGALDELIDALEGAERWAELETALRRRIDDDRAHHQTRADLERIARLSDEVLGAPERAIDAWREIRHRFGDDTRGADALAERLAQAERWDELAGLLADVGGVSIARGVALWTRLGDVRRQRVSDPVGAAEAYARALAAAPGHAAARAGARETLANAEARPIAVRALADAYRATGDEAELLGLLDDRLELAGSGRERAQLLREAVAELERRDDRAGAFDAAARALALLPDDDALADEVARLGAQAEMWAATAEAFRTAGAATPAPRVAAGLRTRAGEVFERHADRADDALDAYAAALTADPADPIALHGVARLAPAAGRWSEAAAAAVRACADAQIVVEEVVAPIASAAADGEAWGDAARAVTEALDAAELPPRVARELWSRVAGWHRDHREAPEAAEQCLRRALAIDAEHLPTLRALAGVQRRTPGPELVATLRAIAALERSDLDPLAEAAEIAAARADADPDADADTDPDVELATSAALELYERAAPLWRDGVPAAGGRSPEVAALWAADQLVARYAASGAHERAVGVIEDLTRLPVAPDARAALMLRGAAIAADEAGRPERAAALLEGVLAADPDHGEAADRLAAIYRDGERLPELLALRQGQLARAEGEAKLALRLEVAALAGLIEQRADRAGTLRANLEDQPGHGETLDALTEVLVERSRFGELADVLEAQAGKLEALADAPGAGALWERAAGIAVERLGDIDDIDRAIAAYRRAVSLAPTPAALDALADLHLRRGEHAEAVPCLEQRLGIADADERIDVALRLASAYEGSGETGRAIARLEEAAPEPAADERLRDPLARLYRAAEAWERLGELLTDALSHVGEERAIELAREASEVFVDRLGDPARAVPALRRAAAADPSDRDLRMRLAAGLREAGELDAAEEALEELLEEFGRRRSPERAQVHFELARVVREQGDLDEAIRHLEQGSQMDVGNAEILGMLAQLARASGQLDRAERAYQSLLMALRRREPGDDPEGLGIADVLVELHFLAAEQGADDRAAELIESAREAAVQSESEMRRLRRALLARDGAALLERALRDRLEVVDDAPARAQTLSYLAEVLALLGNAERALDYQLEAVELAPADAALHRAARELAASTGHLEDYLDTARELLDGLRRAEDADAAAAIALEVGRALEDDQADLAGAAEMYRRAEASGARAAETYSALARVAGALGDAQEQARALNELIKRSGDDTPATERADALYQLAEAYAGGADTLADALDAVERAVDADARYERAATILQRACDSSDDDPGAVAVYKRVARRSNRWEMLLDALERAAASASELPPAEVREGVEIAVAHDAMDRAAALVARAEALARDPSASEEALAAPLSLVEHRAASGDLAAALGLLAEAAEAGGVARVREPLLRLARNAELGDDTVREAAQAYELIRAEEPTARDAWEPLMDIYLRLRDAVRAETVARATLPALVDPSDRNALRVRYARFATEVAGDDDAAVEMLKDALLDQPSCQPAAELLEEILAKGGRDEDLIEFLSQRFDDARARHDVESAPITALRLGRLFEERDPAEARGLYEQALSMCPDDADLLAAMLRQLGDDAPAEDRARWLEQLLAVVEGDEAAERALALASLRDELGDDDGVRRALERGAAAAPAEPRVRERLVAFYRERQHWRPLADLLATSAEALEDAEDAVALLREAARIHADQRQDEAAAAVTLRRARRLVPGDSPLLFEVAGALAAAGDVNGALEELGAAIDGDAMDHGARADALLARAQLRDVVGDAAGALADVDAAYSIEPARAGEALLERLRSALDHARAQADVDGERQATARLASLYEAQGDGDAASALLSGWVTAHPTDRELLHQLRALDERDERWPGVVTACARLVAIEEGDEQRAAALSLADAADRMGVPETARTGLERALEANPADATLRARLRSIYEQAGAHRELASLLLTEAAELEPEARFDRLMDAVALLVGPAGDPDAAIEPLRAAAELRPSDKQVQLRLLDAMVGGGRLDEAKALLEPAIAAEKRRSPYLAALQFRMAKLFRAGGDDDGGYEWMTRAFSTHRKDGELAHSLAEWAARRKDYDVAIKALKAISIMDLGGPMSKVEALLMEAQLEVERGNPKTAQMLARKVLREDPESPEALQLVEQLD